MKLTREIVRFSLCKCKSKSVSSLLKSSQERFCSSSKNSDEDSVDKSKPEFSEESSKSDSENLKLPEEPTNCCMSGCSNCVWIQYAAELSKLMKDGDVKAKKIIMERVKDPNLRAFLLMELKQLQNKKK